jgi:Ca2+-binding RTX toxin-like protein
MRVRGPRGLRLIAGVVAAAAFTAAGAAQAAVPTGNVVQNPGAEQNLGSPPTGWGVSGGYRSVKYGTGGFPAAVAGSGMNLFAGGGNDDLSVADQIVNLSGAATEINSGRVSVVLSATLGGYLSQGDNAKVTAEFQNESSDVNYLKLEVGPVTPSDRNNQTKLLPRSASGIVPPGTHHIRLMVSVTQVSPDDDSNDGYADNVSVVLDIPANDDAATVAQDAAATPVDVLANDHDVNGVPRKVASVTQPAHGTVAITGGGSGLTYAPAAGYCNGQGGAPDTFTYSLNSGGTATVVMTVTCPTKPPPDATTGAASAPFPGTATLEGVVNPRGSATTYHFEYGTSAAYGSSTPNADAGGGTIAKPVSAALDGLAVNTTYHYRLVATSAAGTTLGADRQFLSGSFNCGGLGAVARLTSAPVTAAATFSGTAGPDRIIGTSGSDTLRALAGNDCVLGLAGNDTIDAGAGDDLVAADGACPPGTSEPSFCLPGGAGNDTVTGGSGDDVVDGGAGTDRLSGAEGDDRVRGRSGNDRVSGGSGHDLLSGQTGNDQLRGGSGDDRLRGQSGNDDLSGDTGRDEISGGSGNDTISARDGARDRVDCGSGRDRVTADRIDKVSLDCERVARPRTGRRSP